MTAGEERTMHAERRPRILVVDDDGAVRDLLQLYLAQMVSK